MGKTQLEERFKHLGIPKEELERMHLALLREQEMMQHMEALNNMTAYSPAGSGYGSSTSTGSAIEMMVANFQTRVLANGGVFQSQQCLITLLENIK